MQLAITSLFHLPGKISITLDMLQITDQVQSYKKISLSICRLLNIHTQIQHPARQWCSPAHEYMQKKKLQSNQQTYGAGADASGTTNHRPCRNQITGTTNINENKPQAPMKSNPKATKT
jgi:hypothetical protein